MTIGEIGYLISKWIVYLIVFVTVIYGAYAVYYAYFKMKDEREKHIVVHSSARAFGLILILLFLYYIAQISVNVANVEELTLLWNILHFGLEGDGFSAGTAISMMMSVFGICLFTSKRKAGMTSAE